MRTNWPIVNDANPYESPKSQSGSFAGITNSRARIPLAVTCSFIVLLFIAALFQYTTQLLTSPWEWIAFIYLLLSILGIVAFGLLSLGLFRRRENTTLVGFVLFAIGTLIQIAVSILAP